MSDKPDLPPEFACPGTVEQLWEIVCAQFVALKDQLSLHGQWPKGTASAQNA